jgi:hypothetical protein
MTMIMIFCAGSRVDAVRRLIDAHEVHGYTEIPDLIGSGATGLHMGTRAHPGTSALILAAVERKKADELATSLGELARTCAPEEGLRVFVLPVERMI